MKKAILFGNGFNLMSTGCPSWQNLLASIAGKDNAPILDGIPPTLQYEQVFITPRSNRSTEKGKTEEAILKEAVKNRLKKLKSNEYYKKLISLDVDIFLTTNYDHNFYDNNKQIIKDYDGTEKIYSIRRWKKLDINGKDTWLYNIHGDINRISSIMLGLDHYGGALAKVQDYVKGNYQRVQQIKGTNKTYTTVPSIRNRITSNMKLDPSEYGFTDSKSGLLSWIDAFFFTDLHLIGIALDFSEIDIWWLLTRRARLAKLNLIKNKIYYYPTFPTSEIHHHLPKLRLLKRLGVIIIHHKLTEDIQTDIIDYNSIYNVQLKKLEEVIQSTKEESLV